MKYSFRIICLLALFAGCAEPPHEYRAIYEIKPSFTGFDKEFAKLEPLYDKDFKNADKTEGLTSSPNPRSNRGYLGIDTFDLNGDGAKEIFVWIENSFSCGANHCRFDIYKLDSHGRLELLSSSLEERPPEILASISHGYHDLAFYGWERGEEFYTIFRFDGSQYKSAERIPLDNLIEK